jgi:hypothetical protein
VGVANWPETIANKKMGNILHNCCSSGYQGFGTIGDEMMVRGLFASWLGDAATLKKYCLISRLSVQRRRFSIDATA